jgi:hypothetical protein
LGDQMSGHIWPMAAQDQAELMRRTDNAAFVVSERSIHILPPVSSLIPTRIVSYRT